MRSVLHVTPDLNFAYNFVKPLCSEHISRGFKVTVISTDAYYVNSKASHDLIHLFEKEVEGLKLILLNLRFRIFRLSLFISYFNYIKLLRMTKFDVVICHTSVDSFFPVIFSRFFARGEVIYFNHGVPYLGYSGFFRFLLIFIEKSNLFFAHRSITVSLSMFQALNLLLVNKTVDFIEPGSACGLDILSTSYEEILVERRKARYTLKINQNDLRVLFVGRSVLRKGIYDLLEAWSEFREVNMSLVLVGPTWDDLEHIALPDNVKVEGYNRNMLSYYLTSDILCVPSYHEGFGYTYIEAAACGCVPVCSNIPGPTDFVLDGLTGLTVQPGNVQSIVFALRSLVESPVRMDFLARNAFRSVLKFDRNSVVKNICNYILES